MKKCFLFALTLSGLVAPLYFYDHSEMGSRDLASVTPEIRNLFQKFTDNNFYELELSKDDSYEKFMNDFNSSQTSLIDNDTDWIDLFLKSLPERARRHYTFVHRSYSIQSGTPMAPRVILFTPDARTIMTFNSKFDENNEPIANTTGDDSIEVIEWNSSKVAWEFAELKLEHGKVAAHKNPQSCVMCHAGTPKPILASHAEFYQDKLKPIFPQYPLWPGFYGSVNDIVGVPGSNDTIMANEKETMKHINEFLFDDSEELSRLRKAVDDDPRYLDVVKNEMKIHHENFQPFIDSMQDRPRYRNLIQLSKLYTDNGEDVPSFLASAPYRRTFHKKYGHYIFRPNFYLSTLMSFYQAQAIAKEIIDFPEYDRFKYSLLAAKYNCKGAYNLKSGDLALTDLNKSFDLVYPNISTQESRDRQYLLAYQYNLVNAKKTDSSYLPLFSWNLEGNEEIASYHYGNVFSDLNELVLWHLAVDAFEDIALEDGKDAHEDRHAELNVKDHFESNVSDIELFERSLKENISEVSRFKTSQWNFATTWQNYYGQRGLTQKYKGLPVSKYCSSKFIPEAKKELRQIASEDKLLPHEIYSVDTRLTDIKHVPKDEVFQPIAVNGTRQACESCHANNLMSPQFNADWHSDTYHIDIKAPKEPWYRSVYSEEASIKDKMLKVLDPTQSLPVPFGNLMPYGRRPMDPFSLFCEEKLIENAHGSEEKLTDFSDKFKCKRIQKIVDDEPQFLPSGKPLMVADPSSEENVINCKCRSLHIRKVSLSRKYYHLEY